MRHSVLHSSSPPWSTLMRPPFSCPNVSGKRLIMPMGGFSVRVRNNHVYLVVLSMTRRYNLYLSKDSTIRSVFRFVTLKSTADACKKPKIHMQLLATFTYGNGVPSHLMFPNVCLFFKVNKTKRMEFKVLWNPYSML